MSEEAARPVGRPTAYDAAFCDEVVEHGAKGLGRAEIAFELGVCRQTIVNWEGAHPEFLDAMRRANDASLAWWERQSREGLTMGSNFNAGLWGKAMGGRFPAEPYRERVEHSGDQGGPIKIDGEASAARIAAILEAGRRRLAEHADEEKPEA